MSKDQIAIDTREARPNNSSPPDDSRTPESLRHTTGGERKFRDRGGVRSSPGWEESVRRGRD